MRTTLTFALSFCCKFSVRACEHACECVCMFLQHTARTYINTLNVTHRKTLPFTCNKSFIEEFVTHSKVVSLRTTNEHPSDDCKISSSFEFCDMMLILCTQFRLYLHRDKLTLCICVQFVRGKKKKYMKENNWAIKSWSEE